MEILHQLLEQALLVIDALQHSTYDSNSMVSFVFCLNVKAKKR